MKKQISLRLVVLALCLLSFARGVYRLGEESLWWDESLSHYRATHSFYFILTNQIMLTSGTRELRTLDNHPPLYFILLRCMVLAAGDSEFAMRFLSLMAGVLTVPLLYLCGNRFGRAAGIWAAALGAASPLYLWAQQEARPYALGLMLVVLSFYALTRFLDGGPRRHAFGMLYLLSTSAMLVTHYHSFLLMPAHALMWLFNRRRLTKRGLILLAAVALLAGGALLWGWQMMPPQKVLPGYRFVPLGDLLQDVFRSFALGMPGARMSWFQWIGLGTFLAALPPALSRRRPALLQVLLCFALPIAEVYALFFIRPAYLNVRHLLFASPFFYLVLAAGGGAASEWIGDWTTSPRAKQLAGVATLLLLAALSVGMGRASHMHFADPHYGKEDHRAWGRYLSEHVRPDDLVLVVPGAISELYKYYVDSPAPWLGVPLFELPPSKTLEVLQGLSRRYDRVWVAYSSTPGWANPGNLVLRWLNANARRIDFVPFASPSTTVQVYAFQLRPPLVDSVPTDAASLGLEFGGRVRLLGLALPTGHATAGHVLPLSLYWSATRSLERSYRAVLSLDDDRGFTWAALDYAPCGGAYPTDTWPEGKAVLDRVDLRVPWGVPPGRYRLHLSLYPADRSEPALPVRDGGGQLLGLIVPIGEVDVRRPGHLPADEELPVEHRIGRRYGDLRLLGSNYDGGSYRPGDVVLLDAWWQAVRTPGCDCTFDLQLRDGRERTVAGRVVVPAGEHVPTRWHKGEVVRGQYRLRIPITTPPGDYRLYVAAGGERPCRGPWPWSARPAEIGRLRVRPLPTSGRSFELPPLEHPMNVNLADKVELLGYRLESTTVRPGGVVSCTLYWRGLAEMNQNYTVFTHLVDSDGRVWGQWDNQPQRGQMPTTRWLPRQVVADPYRIPVSPDAPAGNLELRVGMYDLLTMRRLPVYDEQGNSTGDYVSVTGVKVTR